MKKISFWLQTCLWIAALVIVTTIAADKLVMPWLVEHGDEVTVPNVIGQKSEEAQALLKKAGFSVTAQIRFEPGAESGSIIQQSPESGALVKTGRTIHLIVANDQRYVNVPNLRLSTVRDAMLMLQAAGLSPGQIDSQASSEFPSGIVLAQSLPADTSITAGQSVNFTMSTGSTIIEAKVPFLIHKSLADAKKMIVESGLRIGKVEKKTNQDLIPETVLEQSLDSSKVVPPLTTIDLVISALEGEH